MANEMGVILIKSESEQFEARGIEDSNPKKSKEKKWSNE